MTQITDHLADIRERVARAAQQAGRATDSVMIVAVSKQQSAQTIMAAFHAGQKHFGESYVQEAIPKMDALEKLNLTWHFIGRMQANKTRAVAERFQWVHTVDRDRIAARLSEQRPYFAPPLNVLIQVNLGAEPQKGGVSEAEAAALAQTIQALPRLTLRGLMTIPPQLSTAAETQSLFRRLAALRVHLAAGGIAMDTLSMGMSVDFESAIAAGSTCVRIGTAIFGPRAATAAP
ncbi:MAG TPA: YggS family pyridoxal phosphate-dependent enzyme [Gammaproteobacteria bacterium]|nr:YggS family pyridoxal phosphate-dependent enzyme [Gammaproteobacteria bacterium]